jgi:hypothetical protein
MSRIKGKSGTFAAEVARKQEEENVAREKGNELLGRTPFESNALKQLSYATDAQAVSTQIARTPATQYLVLNSKDRNQTSGTGVYSRQPWNRFRLQRPQNIMNTFATRMLVSEINFPFYVPNVNFENNQFFIQTLSTSGVETMFEVNLNIGYYGANVSAAGGNLNLATVITNILDGTDLGVNGFYIPVLGGTGLIAFPPTVAVNVDNSFRWVATAAQPFALFFSQPGSLLPITNFPSESTYYNTASLLQMMGMDYFQVSGQVIAVGAVGNPTTLQYTQYVDIVSE